MTDSFPAHRELSIKHMNRYSLPSRGSDVTFAPKRDGVTPRVAMLNPFRRVGVRLYVDIVIAARWMDGEEVTSLRRANMMNGFDEYPA